MRHRTLQQTCIFEVVLKANLQVTEIVVQTDGLTVNLKNGKVNACRQVQDDQLN